MSEIRDAVKIAYKEMPPVFDGIYFADRVREIVSRERMYSETVFRMLRSLRQVGAIHYKCIGEKRLSQYEKEEVKE